MRQIIQFILLLWITLLLSPPLLYSEQWINPKEAIRDPMIARLQQGRKELTDLEKEEIKMYGYTGLELMTYVDDNQEQGEDNETIYRLIQVNKSEHIRVYEFLMKKKYYYKTYPDLLTYNGIKAGDLEWQAHTIFLGPPNWRATAFFDKYYLNSLEIRKKREAYTRFIITRKIQHFPAQHGNDNWFLGSVFTFDDVWYQEPWEDENRILGKDIVKGKVCFIVESKNRIDPNYPLSKRVTWVEDENFLDLHEEQFDRKGNLVKVYDKEWQMIKPWNYWVITQWNALNLVTQDRTILQSFEWVFDKGVDDKEFSFPVLESENIWREFKNLPPPIRKVSDLPQRPKIRWEFWNKIGVKPLVKN